MVTTIDMSKSEAPLAPLAKDRPEGKNSNIKKLRYFQTFLSDEELLDCNLMSVVPPTNDRLWTTIFNIGEEKPLPSMLLLHKLTQPKSLINSTFEVNHVKPKRSDWEGYFDDRILELREAAIEDGINISEISIAAARSFLGQLAFLVRPSMFLSPTGNVRLVWENARGEQIGLQFREDDAIQYIFFRDAGDLLENLMGVVRSSSITALIEDFGLTHLVLAAD